MNLTNQSGSIQTGVVVREGSFSTVEGVMSGGNMDLINPVSER